MSETAAHAMGRSFLEETDVQQVPAAGRVCMNDGLSAVEVFYCFIYLRQLYETSCMNRFQKPIAKSQDDDSKKKCFQPKVLLGWICLVDPQEESPFQITHVSF